MANIGNGAVNGQVNFNVTPVSADYTALVTDELIAVTTGASAINVFLPAPTPAGTVAQAVANPVLGVTGQGNAGQRVTIMKVDTGGGTVVINGTLPNYIRAAGKVTLTSNGSSATFQAKLANLA